MSAGKLTCGQMITKNTTLTADVGPCPADGIIIGADNIRLNLNGHSISGSPAAGDGNAAGIRLPFRTGVIITGHPGKSGKTATVTGFDAGVFVNGGSGNTIENLVIRDNIGPSIGANLGDGILISSSNNNLVGRNVVRHNGPYDGIGLVGTSDANRIEGNTVEDNDVPGKLTAPDSPSREIQVDKGISVGELQDSVTNTVLVGNQIRRSGADGIYVTGSGSLIRNNTSEDNGFLADVFSVPASGIRLIDTADNTVVENNRVFRNAVNGIAVSSEANRITGNVAFENGGGAARGRGSDLSDFHGSCTENVWQGNTFGTAYPGCIQRPTWRTFTSWRHRKPYGVQGHRRRQQPQPCCLAAPTGTT
ncbi:MAG: right-handed parallel beta-helix repeat-containing protein [Actinobacteria bacterium]|nr:right-handed parallel beta-helix repeat-containing protein [Actinomycetota bacterium]